MTKENVTTSSTSETPDYVKGLEGVIAARQPLSLVDGALSKLYYRGIPIHELSEASSYEEVVYLLWEGKLPTPAELAKFTKELAAARHVPKGILDIVRLIPRNAHPMAALRTLASALGVFDPKEKQITPEIVRQQALSLTAVFPTLIAAFYRHREGKKIVSPDPKLSHSADFLFMLHGKKQDPKMVKALDAYLILLADHGLNASTFSARVTASTQADLYSAVTSAIGTLKGDLHGSANQRAMEMILDIDRPERAETYVEDLLSQKKKIMGFGHRVYKKQDPRAVAFREIARDLCESSGNGKWMEISDRVEKYIWEKKQIPCNVDFYSASVLYVLGFPVDFFTTVFAASRVAGWAAHVMDQQKDNRLIRPSSQYIGPRDQHYVPIEKR